MEPPPVVIILFTVGFRMLKQLYRLTFKHCGVVMEKFKSRQKIFETAVFWRLVQRNRVGWHRFTRMGSQAEVLSAKS